MPRTDIVAAKEPKRVSHLSLLTSYKRGQAKLDAILPQGAPKNPDKDMSQRFKLSTSRLLGKKIRMTTLRQYLHISTGAFVGALHTSPRSYCIQTNSGKALLNDWVRGITNTDSHTAYHTYAISCTHTRGYLTRCLSGWELQVCFGHHRHRYLPSLGAWGRLTSPLSICPDALATATRRRRYYHLSVVTIRSQ